MGSDVLSYFEYVTVTCVRVGQLSSRHTSYAYQVRTAICSHNGGGCAVLKVFPERLPVSNSSMESNVTKLQL